MRGLGKHSGGVRQPSRTPSSVALSMSEMTSNAVRESPLCVCGDSTGGDMGLNNQDLDH